MGESLPLCVLTALQRFWNIPGPVYCVSTIHQPEGREGEREGRRDGERERGQREQERERVSEREREGGREEKGIQIKRLGPENGKVNLVEENLRNHAKQCVEKEDEQ